MARSFALIILLVSRGTVVGVVGVVVVGGGGVVYIVISFLPVASEMIKLVILLTASTASSISSITASTAGTANFTFIQNSLNYWFATRNYVYETRRLRMTSLNP